jgi:predicted amidophosphoribosyltransferase
VLPDVLVPVPLHPTRLRARGFNQAALLARALGERLDRSVIENLRRVRFTPPQVGLGRAARSANVTGAFRATSPIRIGELVGLVDDVATSGATLAAGAAALTVAGAARIVGVTFALASGGLPR